MNVEKSPSSRSEPFSKHLAPAQLRGIDKIGNAMIPGADGFPSFAASGCVRHADRILDYMPAADLRDLAMLLGILGALPGFFARLLILVLELGSRLPGALGAPLRFIRLGLRGLIFSLYYGDPAITDRIGYKVGVYTGDL